VNTCNFCSLPTVDFPFGLLVPPHPLAIPHGKDAACNSYYEPLVSRALKLLLIDGVASILGAPPLDPVTKKIISAPTTHWLRTPWVSDRKKGTPFFYNVHLLILIEHFCHSDVPYTPWCNLVNFLSRQKRNDGAPLTHLNLLDSVYVSNPHARLFRDSVREIWGQVGQGMGPITKAPGHRVRTVPLNRSLTDHWYHQYTQIAPRAESPPSPSSDHSPPTPSSDHSPSILPSSPSGPSKRPRSARSVSPRRVRVCDIHTVYW
jgi:hypothetical protein